MISKATIDTVFETARVEEVIAMICPIEVILKDESVL
jgi:hypothetical protein